MHALVRLGQAERAGQFLARLGEQDREREELRVAAAALRLAQGDPQAATAALAPGRRAPMPRATGDTGRPADVLEALAKDALGDRDGADAALERALDLSDADGALLRSCCTPRRACWSAMPGARQARRAGSGSAACLPDPAGPRSARQPPRPSPLLSR